MTNLSKRKLKRETIEQIFDQLIGVLKVAQNKNCFSLVLSELLTPTENLMLAKRLATVLLLFGKMPQHRIAELIKVSPTTVAKFSLQVEMGKFDSLRSISEKEKHNLEKIVWLLLTAGGIMPPRSGGKYWRKKGFKAFLEK